MTIQVSFSVRQEQALTLCQEKQMIEVKILPKQVT